MDNNHHSDKIDVFNEEEKKYTIDNLQDYISLGITEYIRDHTNNLTAKSLIEDCVDQMLKLSKNQYNNEQILENIEPLNNCYLTQVFYDTLKQKIINRK